jgi:HemK-related putative methylase
MNVYPPSEDTFLLEDALRSIRESAEIIVEVGSGSGYVSRVLREIYPQAFIVSTDISLEAAKASSTRDMNGDTYRMDMLSALRRVDMAVFNPPYLPSERHYLEGCGVDRSWAGGVDGREVIDQFVSAVRDVSVVYLLLCSLNREEEVAGAWSGHRVSTILRRHIEGEKLLVLRAERK